ncbi:MAG: ribosomal-processing cysteine protease Prp [Bacillaceae bacterium]|nr:ribosomal-processing cysteine protease Prp [Bacillaceae bacterium]
MIKVQVTRNQNQEIDTITITGHAQFDEPGRDIVCAAVSAISFGLINSVEMLLDEELHVTMNEKEGGFLRISPPDRLNREKREKVLLLLEAMVASIQSVARDYSEYVQIEDLDQPGGESS